MGRGGRSLLLGHAELFVGVDGGNSWLLATTWSFTRRASCRADRAKRSAGVLGERGAGRRAKQLSASHPAFSP